MAWRAGGHHLGVARRAGVGVEQRAAGRADLRFTGERRGQRADDPADARVGRVAAGCIVRVQLGAGHARAHFEHHEAQHQAGSAGGFDQALEGRAVLVPADDGAQREGDLEGAADDAGARRILDTFQNPLGQVEAAGHHIGMDHQLRVGGTADLQAADVDLGGDRAGGVQVHHHRAGYRSLAGHRVHRAEQVHRLAHQVTGGADGAGGALGADQHVLHVHHMLAVMVPAPGGVVVPAGGIHQVVQFVVAVALGLGGHLGVGDVEQVEGLRVVGAHGNGRRVVGQAHVGADAAPEVQSGSVQDAHGVIPRPC